MDSLHSESREYISVGQERYQFDSKTGNLHMPDGRKIAITKGGKPVQNIAQVQEIVHKVAKSLTNVQVTEIQVRDQDHITEQEITLIFADHSQKTAASSALDCEVEKHAQEFGNKAANLMVLDRIVSSVSSPTFQTKVPPILPLSHAQIYAHIQQHYPDFDKDWERFTLLQGKEEGLQVLEDIRNTIRTLFQEHPIQVDLSTLGEGPLMVRSTGREDTKEGAMAGANESIAGVASDPQEVSAAIGSVVASYLSEASMMQKLIAGMNIEEKPFMPVLLQVMVGEKPNTPIPAEGLMVAGVSYTKEMAGETKELTVVEAAFGHNEGVVNALIPTDTYYIYPDHPTHQIIAQKPDRLIANDASMGDSRFERSSNPAALAKKPALSPEQLQHMRKVSKAIHDAYGQPMDIEWVYDPTNKSFYVVQARPLVQRFRAEPGVVNQERLSQVAKGRMIVHRGGEPVILTDASQLIQRRNLDAALKEFLKPEVRGQIRAVVVEEMGSALSHAACVFRENGIPVLVASGIDAGAFRTKGTVAVLDSQQALIGTIQSESFAGKEAAEVKTTLLEDNTLKPGWHKHPIGPDESLQDYGLSAEDYGRLGHLLVTDVSVGDINLTNLFAKLSSENPQEVKEAARLIVTRIAVTVKNLHTSETGLADSGKRLLSNALVILETMLQTEDRMQLLHAARRLEALCYQESSCRILECESIRTLLVSRKAVMGFDRTPLQLDASDKTILTFLKHATLSKVSDEATVKALQEPMTDQEVDACVLVFRSIKPLLLDEASKARWEELTTKLVASRSRIANQLLIDLITQVEKAGILTEWLNLVVAESPVDMGSSLGLIVQWRDQWRSIRPIMNEVVQLKKNLTQLESAGAAWKNPRAFDALWHQMQSDVVAPLKTQIAALVGSKEQNKLLQAALHRVIIDGVEALDHSIKFARSDTQEAVEPKVERFSTMLETYLELMLQLFDAIPEENFSTWTAGICTANPRLGGSASYRQLMRETITSTFEKIRLIRTAAQVEPSASANVMAQCVNSGALFSLNFFPDETTLEDMFTLCHQNMLAALDCFRPAYNTRLFPDSLNEVLSSIESIDEPIIYGQAHLSLHPSMTCQTVRYPIVTTVYNLPIKYHSGKITIEHNLIRGTTTLKFDVYGHNMNDRMDLIALLLASRSWNDGLQMTSIPMYDEGTKQLSCTLECSKDIKKVSTLILDAAVATLAGNFGTVPVLYPDALLTQNPQVLSVPIRNPGQLRQLLSSSTRGNIYVWDLVKQVFARGDKIPVEDVCALLHEVGVHVQANTHQELFANLSALFMHELTTNKDDKQVAIGSYGHKVPVDPVKRLIITEAKLNTTFIHLFWNKISQEDFSLFLSGGPGEIEGSGLYPDLCAAYAEYLATSQQEDLLFTFINYLVEQGQFASLLCIQERVDRPTPQMGKVPAGFAEPVEVYNDDSGTDYEEDSPAAWDEEKVEKAPTIDSTPKPLEPYQRIDNALGRHLIAGRRATESEMSDERSHPVDIHSLQPGQWILIPSRTRDGGYIKGLYKLAEVQSVTQDPFTVIIKKSGDKLKPLESQEYLKALVL